jgi:hypothetical protein
MIRDEVEVMITEGVWKIIIYTDSQAALNRIQHNGPGPGQTWASAIIRTKEEICRLNIQLEFRWVPGHAGIAGNDTADQVAKDAAAQAKPDNHKNRKIDGADVLSAESRPCPYLKRIKKAEDDKCWWCNSEVVQSREHLLKHCKHGGNPRMRFGQQ